MGLRALPRLDPVLGVALFLLVLGAGPAWADDCTDWGNCAMAPRNIDVATGIAAAGPFILLGWRYLARRNGVVAAGLAPPLLSAAELRTNVDEVKEEFERLQQALSDEVFSQLRNIRDFDKSYNEKWLAAADALGDYMKAYPDLLPDLQALWEQFGGRERAREIAQWADAALLAASVGVGVYRMASAAAAEEVAARIAAARMAARAQLARQVAVAEARAQAQAQLARAVAETEAQAARAAAPAGGLGRTILYGDEKNMIELAKNIKPLPGYFDVFLHGNRTGLAFKSGGKWVEMTADDVLRAMRANGYKGGPVRLVACEAGGGIVEGRFVPGVAKQLSERLGTQVIAPNQTAWLLPSGNLRIGSNPFIPSKGYWTGYGFGR